MNKFRFNIKLFVLLCVVLLTVALTCCSCVNNTPPDEESPTEDPPLWASNFNLPNAEEALNKLVDIYGGADKVFLLMNNNIARMPCPQGEVITINATFEVGEYAKLIIDDSIAEFNEIFAVINPNYKFATNYTPSDDDFANKYSVRLSASDNLAVTETSQVFGVAHVGYYNNYTELGDFGITIKSEVFNNGSYLMTTFKHELMHLLGAGDAYKNSSATKDTVMQNYTVNGYHSLSQTDVAFLDALYRNPEFNGDEKIPQYITTYETNSLHTKAKLTAKVYTKLVTDLNPTTVKNEASALGYKNLTDFFNTVSNGIKPDVTFGKSNISFKEIEFIEAPATTYYGSIDAQNKKYTHGQQKGLMGNAQTINCIDYGNGIWYAAPNGNQYMLMIQMGSYVLSFKLGGSFTNFADLSLTLWHVSA
ncbi:MAG: hypothetical protein J1G02_05130 [Clostridiales bacterium]|nr:hypothetical protein [Clostridiales bacterium]